MLILKNCLFDHSTLQHCSLEIQLQVCTSFGYSSPSTHINVPANHCMYMYYTTEWDHLLINFMITHLCDNSLVQPHPGSPPAFQ